MKLKAILSGITLMLLCWMTAAFVRPVPAESYNQNASVQQAPEQSEELRASIEVAK